MLNSSFQPKTSWTLHNHFTLQARGMRKLEETEDDDEDETEKEEEDDKEVEDDEEEEVKEEQVATHRPSPLLLPIPVTIPASTVTGVNARYPELRDGYDDEEEYWNEEGDGFSHGDDSYTAFRAAGPHRTLEEMRIYIYRQSGAVSGRTREMVSQRKKILKFAFVTARSNISNVNTVV